VYNSKAVIYDGNDWDGTAITFIDLQEIVDLYIFANFSNNVALERDIITFARDIAYCIVAKRPVGRRLRGS
jgi:hypothetical protein